MAAKLHEIIIDVLKLSNKPLSIREISDRIKKEKLWFRPSDNKLPETTQISARVNNYPHLFLRNDGVVKLLKNRSLENKITRLTYNDRGWVEPSGWERKSRTPGLHEADYGFGHEEWLFDFNRLIKKYKYGFIEGFRTKNNKHGGQLYNVQLFTIDGVQKQKYWVAKINNCYVLDVEEQIQIQKQFIAKGWMQENEEQLKQLNLWNKESRNSLNTFAPNVRFFKEDVIFFNPPVPVVNSKYIKNRDRYLLYEFDEAAEINIEDIYEFSFKPSTPNSYKKIWRKNKPEFESKEIKLIHRQIAESLYKMLSIKFGIKNIGCDIPNHSGTYIDMVRKEGSQYIFYEIKTYSQLRKNIREAMGQLLEYAFWNRSKHVKEIVIVSDKKLEGEAEAYLFFLKHSLKIPISYLQQQ